MDGIVFIARLGSTRLSQKHLLQSRGKTFIEWLILRFVNAFQEEIDSKKLKLVLLTADEPVNRRFEEVLKNYPVTVFYGSPENIPLRLLQCCDHFNFDNLVSVDGDDILCSAEGAREVWKGISSSKEPVMVKTVGLPLGMNVMAMSKALLAGKRSRIGTGKLETGWGWIFEDAKIIEINSGSFGLNEELRFTLDYPEDGEFFKTIIEQFDVLGASDQELISWVIEHKVYQVNKHLNEEYWKNFKQQQSNEKN
jgi:spore coat polysaccharide biosynthesis protein SpsF